MRILFGLLFVFLLSACATISSGGGASEKDQVAAATQAWIDGMASHDPERVGALYATDAVLWGTTSPTIRDNPAAIRGYFNLLTRVPPDYKGILGEQRIRVYGDVAINTGTYTFIGPARDSAGNALRRPARFTFVYHKRDGRWLIVDHHSSAMPQSPK